MIANIITGWTTIDGPIARLVLRWADQMLCMARSTTSYFYWVESQTLLQKIECENSGKWHFKAAIGFLLQA